MTRNKKKISTTITEKKEVDLLIKLEYDQFTKTELLRCLLHGYIDDEPNVRNYINEYKQEHKAKSKLKQGRINILERKRKEINNLYGLPKEEIEQLFDIFDKDFPD
jgi:hypothetical protein